MLSSSGATLLVFVHPYCPCARATLSELAVIMATCRSRLTAHVHFVVSEGANPNWDENELWQTANTIPGVRTLVDTKGTEALACSARTSGHTLLFNERGTCLFAGGITAARGHAGDNIGRQAVLSYLGNNRPETDRAPTFGCPLFAEGPTVASEDNL
jgi:hypothetical protein